MSRRTLKWVGWGMLGLILLTAVVLAFFNWNWLKGPLERKSLEDTGRPLVIGGDFRVKLGWPNARVDAGQVRFANPTWAAEKQMLTADRVTFAINLPSLIAGIYVLPRIELVRPVLDLERSSDGRANWHLDPQQQGGSSKFRMGVLRLDHGKLLFDDPAESTSIRADLSTATREEDRKEGNTDRESKAGLKFVAKGKHKGLPFAAHGEGGSALALSRESEPYPIAFEATVGQSWIKADGTITDILRLSAIDMQVNLKGDSLGSLFPQLGLALPETNPYNLTGHITRDDHQWRFEKFAGNVGKSDLAGTLQVDTGRPRAFLHGEVVSKRLQFADLGPLVGTGNPAQAAAAPVPKDGAQPKRAPAKAVATTNGLRVLPRRPYKSERWTSVDAEVKFSAHKIDRAEELPLQNLVTVIKLRDSVLTLDPFDAGIAGGHLEGIITLDGTQDPIASNVKMHARKLLLGELLPTVKLANQSVGQINGQIDLAGTGNTVGDMLASSNGKVAFVTGEGRVSRLMMEQIGLHLPEIVLLKIRGDEIVGIRCGIADFSVRKGIMKADTLVLDTDVNTINGFGTVDLGHEKVDLTLVPQTKTTSLVALRAPIHLRGSLGKPEISLDATKAAARGLGALALGLLNPFLALVPLVEPARENATDCGRLAKEAKGPAQKSASRLPASKLAKGANGEALDR